MARIEIRLDDHEKASLQRAARTEGKSLTQLIKERLFGAERDDWQEAIERRLSRLEEMAGL